MDGSGEAAAARRSGNGAWEIVLVRRDPATAWSDPCVKLFLLWSAAIAVSVALYVFAGYVWGSVATAAFLVAGCWLTCRCCLKPPELLPVVDADGGIVQLRRVAVVQVNGGSGAGGLSQAEIDAVPVFEYRRKEAAAAEQCSVCINVVRDGEAVRRLPACAHTFHAPCIDGWLRAHATCPMCRADVKVKVAAAAVGVGLPVPEESSAA